MIYQYEARGADKAITDAIDTAGGNRFPSGSEAILSDRSPCRAGSAPQGRTPGACAARRGGAERRRLDPIWLNSAMAEVTEVCCRPKCVVTT